MSAVEDLKRMKMHLVISEEDSWNRNLLADANLARGYAFGLARRVDELEKQLEIAMDYERERIAQKFDEYVNQDGGRPSESGKLIRSAKMDR